jgi:hypothetical protein
LTSSVISGKIISWLKTSVIGVKRSIWYILHNSERQKYIFVADPANMSGIKLLQALGKGKRYLFIDDPTEICEGVKILGGKVAKESTKTDTSWSGGLNIPIRTTTGIPENIVLLLRVKLDGTCDPKKSCIIKMVTRETMTSQI